MYKEVMKGNKLKLLYVAALALALSACSDDEGGGEGNLTQPVTFTSSIQALEDSEENEGWSETLDPRVAIRTDGEVKRYQVDTEGNLTATDPFYWDGRSSLTVDAWYPYNNGVYPEEVVVKANQSTPSLFQQSNLMEVLGAEVTPDSPRLTFVHRTVRVVCDLTLPVSAAKTRAADNPFAGAAVTLLNISGVEEGNRVRTSPNRAAYIPPQTIPAGTEFIDQRLAVSDAPRPAAEEECCCLPYGWGFERQNLRAHQVEAFSWSLCSSQEYVFYLRATAPGEYILPPAQAHAMYAPELRGRSASGRVVVE